MVNLFPEEVFLTRMLRILWFNWKDIGHPEAGGAEIFTHEEAEAFWGGGNPLALGRGSRVPSSTLKMRSVTSLACSINRTFLLDGAEM